MSGPVPIITQVILPLLVDATSEMKNTVTYPIKLLLMDIYKAEKGPLQS
jgi:hypothetical protein